jgi:hypothetical protein
MSIAAVAEESGLTSRRVRSVLKKLIDDDIIRLSIRIIPNTGDIIWVTFRISWNPQEISHKNIREVFKKTFPNQYFRALHSATEPLMWADFIVEQVRESEKITHAIRSIPSAKVEYTILPFPGKFFPGMMDATIDALLADAGLL